MNDHISASQIDGKYHLGHGICKQKGITVILKAPTTHTVTRQTFNTCCRRAGWTAKVLVITMKLGL